MDKYLENAKAKTGKSWQEFRELAREKGLIRHSDIIAWLKAEYALGHGHANAVAHMALHADEPRESNDQRVDAHFTGAKAQWRPSFDALVAEVKAFGPDVDLSTGKTYISLVRGGKKFGIVQVSGKRMDIGIKLRGAPFDDTYTDASAWNPMVTHRVQITESKQIDADLLARLKQAYNEAK